MNNKVDDFVLHAQAVTKRFNENRSTSLTVLHGVDLQVSAGETVAIVGASGSGKSTLLHMLGGLDKPSSGAVHIMGRNWCNMNLAEQGSWRNQHLGFVYQFHHLLPECTAMENVSMPLLIRRVEKSQANSAALEILKQVGLEQRTLHYPSQLSGGERQRVAIARALVTRPCCVLADEPTGNLDRNTAAQVFDLMLKLAQEQRTAFVVVSHDETIAKSCKRKLRMEQGKLLPVGL